MFEQVSTIKFIMLLFLIVKFCRTACVRLHMIRRSMTQTVWKRMKTYHGKVFFSIDFLLLEEFIEGENGGKRRIR